MKTLYETLQPFVIYIGFKETSDTLIKDYFRSLSPLEGIDECDIMRVVGADFKIDPERMKIHAHPRPISFPRQICMFLIYKGLKTTLQDAGAPFTKGHATVIHACKSISNMYETNREFRQRFDRIIAELGITLEMLAPNDHSDMGITR